MGGTLKLDADAAGDIPRLTDTYRWMCGYRPGRQSPERREPLNYERREEPAYSESAVIARHRLSSVNGLPSP